MAVNGFACVFLYRCVLSRTFAAYPGERIFAFMHLPHSWLIRAQAYQMNPKAWKALPPSSKPSFRLRCLGLSSTCTRIGLPG